MARLIREHDWGATPLGPIGTWPDGLKTMVGVALGAPQAMWIGWGPTLVQIYNDACRNLLDAERHPAALGRPAAETWADNWSVVGPQLGSVLAGGPSRLSADLLRLCGHDDGTCGRRFTCAISPIPDEGAARGVGGVLCLVEGTPTHPPGSDQDRDGFLLHLSDRLRVLSDPAEIQGVASRMLGRRLGADRAFFGLIVDEGAAGACEVLRGHHDPDVPSPGGWLGSEEVAPAHWGDLRAGRTVAVADLPGGSPPAEAARGPFGIRSYLAVPLVKDGRFAAVLAVQQGRPRRWTEADLRLAEEVAERTWTATERARLEAVLRQSEERFRAMLETARDYAIFTTDVDGRIETWPPGARAVFGWTSEEAVGRPMDIIFLPDDQEEGVPARERREANEKGHASDVRWHRRKDGSRVFIEGVARPLTGPDGAVTGYVKVGREMVERRATEAALHQSEARLGAIFANASVGLSEVTLDGTFLRVNDEICRILGRPREEVMRLGILQVTHPEDVAGTVEAVTRVVQGQGSAGLDKRYLRPDGTQVWANSHGTLLHHGDGQPDTLLVVTADLTARRAAEAALRDSEARFRQFGDASGDVLWIRDAESLTFEYVSPAFEEIFGTRLQHVLDSHHLRRWAEMILPDDRVATLASLRRVRDGDHVRHSFRILRSDGAVRWIRDTSFPLFNEEGRIQRIGGIYHDATEEVELQDRLRVLVAELQHRSRNLVGVMRGVAERTLATSETLEEFRARFRARIDALGRVNALLSRLDEGDRITFDELLGTELAAHGVLDEDGQGGQVRLGGPKGIRLRSATVQTFALAIHELATNALKHGALSHPEGRLEVTWDLVRRAENDWRLRVDWRETGSLPASPDVAGGSTRPLHQGYGRELIERALPYQLKAQTRYELTPDGVHCTIAVPVSSTMGVAFSSQAGGEA